MRPQLKPIAVIRRGDEVALVSRALEATYLDDSDGSTSALLALLSEGKRTIAELPGAMLGRGYAVTEEEMADAVTALDEAGVLLRADSEAGLAPAVLRRHESNLRFYDLYAGMRRTAADYHRAMAGSSVLLLGAGGLGSGVLQSLVGLGAGRVRLVDFDTVEEKNLARQFAYSAADLGRPKVEAARDWVRRYSPGGTLVEAVHERIESVADVQRLGAGADVVICAVDTPDDVHLTVNEACFELGVPYVVAGLQYSMMFYWSVEPGFSPCRLCLELNRSDSATATPSYELTTVQPSSNVNRATGPIAQLLAGFVTMEAARYLTRTDPPVAAATYQMIELTDGMQPSTDAWPANSRCPLCTRGTRR